MKITVNKHTGGANNEHNNELTVISLEVQSVMRSVIKGPRSHLTHCHDTHYHTRHVTVSRARAHTHARLCLNARNHGARVS